MKLSRETLNELAIEEKTLDNLAQCGEISKYFPELSQAILNNKRALENLLEENGIELGSVV
jgi:hypothetical protein